MTARTTTTMAARMVVSSPNRGHAAIYVTPLYSLAPTHTHKHTQTHTSPLRTHTPTLSTHIHKQKQTFKTKLLLLLCSARIAHSLASPFPLSHPPLATIFPYLLSMCVCVCVCAWLYLHVCVVVCVCVCLFFRWMASVICSLLRCCLFTKQFVFIVCRPGSCYQHSQAPLIPSYRPCPYNQTMPFMYVVRVWQSVRALVAIVAIARGSNICFLAFIICI